MKTLQRIFLYLASILHLPWTLVRVIVSTILLVDLWCDKVINNWLEKLNKEIKEETKQTFVETSFLYKNAKDVIITSDIKQENGKIHLDFFADCGKFGTDESLDGYILTPKRLLQILQERNDIKDNEM